MTNEVKTYLENLRVQLLKTVARSDGPSQLPFNVAWAHEVFRWRLFDLASSSTACWDRRERIPAAVLARSCLETAASIHHCYLQVQAVIDGRPVAEVDPIVKRLVLGRKDKEDALHPINVLTCLQQMSKKTGIAFERIYNEISEYAHPNWFGSAGSYSKRNSETGDVELGIGIDTNEYIDAVIDHSLSASLQLASMLRQFMIDVWPLFVKSCNS